MAAATDVPLTTVRKAHGQAQQGPQPGAPHLLEAREEVQQGQGLGAGVHQ